MLGGRMFSRSVPSLSSLSANTASPTGKMDTLCSVVRSGTTQAVYKHLHVSSVDINDEEITEKGEACTPLSEAIRTRNHCTTRLLLDFEADPMQGLSDSPTTTAVSLAAASADSERLLLLLLASSTIMHGLSVTHSYLASAILSRTELSSFRPCCADDLISMVVLKASFLRREDAKKAVPLSTITSLTRDIRETQRRRPARKPAWVAATFL